MKQKFYSQVNMERVFFFYRQGSLQARQFADLFREEGMRFGIIGAGRIGKIHAANVAARADSKVRFVADADAAAAEALARSTGAAVASIDEILGSSEVDAVAICAPTDMHADLIEKAARARKAIFCEKPIDLDAERIRRCLDVVKSTGATLMVGFNRRFDPNFASLQARIASGMIGDLEIVSITSRDPGPPPISYIARSGGLFRDMMIHDFDMARFLLGEEPVAISAMGSALVDKAIGEAGDIDTAVVVMETKSGRVAQISNSRRAAYGYDQRVEAHGSKGMLHAGNIRETTVEFAGAQGHVGDKVLNFFLERYAGAYRAELDAFIGAVKSGAKPTPDGEDGLKANILADAAYLSWRTKQRVAIA
jgi:myo-inositol 2-dehydrogenase / D-chiro-inositol 1-dehydrogenase